jgi:hypothetical protein
VDEKDLGELLKNGGHLQTPRTVNGACNVLLHPRSHRTDCCKSLLPLLLDASELSITCLPSLKCIPTLLRVTSKMAKFKAGHVHRAS